MSEREKLEHKEKIKRLDLKRIQAYDKLIGKIGLVIGGLILLIGIIISIVWR